MEKREIKIIFGLIGKNISYSFSKNYFTKKFELLALKDHYYLNFDIETIKHIKNVLQNHRAFLKGLNVTIPYKEVIIHHLDKIHPKAKKIGAVNTIKITKKGNLKGYNTDEYGFRKSLKPLLKKHHKKALILGTGGASKAIAYALDKLGLAYTFVSRSKTNQNVLQYSNLDQKILKEYSVIINCTPLGTFPNVSTFPEIPYQFVGKEHILYDLVYNPSETVFLQKGKKQGAIIKNGLEMLELQAEKAWRIWNK